MVELVIPAFLAGLFMFLAPCTLPLVPAYLAIVSGVPLSELQDPEKFRQARGRMVLNGLGFVIGFSLVFIALGALAGAFGQFLVEYRLWIARAGGLLVIAFGFYMLEIVKIPALAKTVRFKVPDKLPQGTWWAALAIGAIFAFGWSPCIGPVLGSILLFASLSSTVWQGVFLLIVFCLGFAIPFMLIAVLASSATKYVRAISKYLRVISVIGGVFLILIGFMMITDNMGWFIGFGYQLLDFLNYEKIIDYL